MLVVRHHDRPGVLAHVFNHLRSGNLNVQETENVIFEGAEAAVARINLDGAPSSQLYLYTADSAQDVWEDRGTLWAFRSSDPAVNDYGDLSQGESVEGTFVPVPRDVAVGYRAQSGQRQWLFYRSLAPAGNRTLVGQNIAGEFCAGRLLDSGKFDEWIEIEACSNDE